MLTSKDYLGCGIVAWIFILLLGYAIGGAILHPVDMERQNQKVLITSDAVIWANGAGSVGFEYIRSIEITDGTVFIHSSRLGRSYTQMLLGEKAKEFLEKYQKWQKQHQTPAQQ